MAFQAGAVVGEARLDTKGWTAGVGTVQKTSNALMGMLGPLAGLAGFAGVTAAIVAATKSANEYQKELTNVSTLVNGSTEDFQDMSRRILTMSGELGSATEITQGLYQAISAGASAGDEAFSVVETGAKFAKAALTDNLTAVDILTTAMNAYGKENMSASRAGDLFFKTIEKGKINGAQLSAVIGQSIPIFASSGIAMEELTAGVAALTLQGVSASESTTQLNAIVNAFLKPSEALAESIQRQGYESGAALLKAEGLAGALALLEEETQGDAAAVAELVPNVRGMAGVMALSGEGGKNFTRILGDMKTAAGSVDVAFAKQEKTWETFKNTVGRTAIIVGNIGKAFADSIAGGAQRALESINAFLLSAEGLEFFAGIAEHVGAAWGFLTEVFDIFAEALTGPIMEAIAEITESFRSLFDEAEGGVNVFTLLGGAVEILSGGFQIIINSVTTAITSLVGLFKTGMSLIDMFGAMWDALRGKGQEGAITAAWDDVQKNFTSVTGAVGEGWKKQIEIVRETFSGLRESAEENGERIQESMDRSSKKAAGAVRKNYMGIVLGYNRDVQALAETTVEATETIAEGSAAAVEAAKTPWQSFMDWVVSNFESMKEFIFFTAETVMDLVSTMSAGIQKIKNQQYTNELAALENKNAEETEIIKKQHADELAALTAAYNAGYLTEAEYQAKSLALENEQASELERIQERQLQRENDIRKRQFESQKKSSIAQVWIDAAVAVIGFWRAFAGMGIPGIILAGVMSGVVVGLAAAQTAVISRQQFVPAREEGGMTGGMTRINEAGGEIVNLPDGSLVIPNDISRQIAAGVGDARGGGVTVNVSFDGARIADGMDLDMVTRYVSEKLGRELRTAGVR